MAGPDMQAVRNFFQIDGGIVRPRGGFDLGVADGDRIYFDADFGLPLTYITRTGGRLEFVMDGTANLRIFPTYVGTDELRPLTDATRNIGIPAARYTEGLFYARVGIHSGAAWQTSLQSGGIDLAGLPALTHFGPEQLQLGDGGAPYVPTVPSIGTEANITTPVDGMIYYNPTLVRFRGRQAGIWVNLS